jgi:hypothetical protein
MPMYEYVLRFPDRGDERLISDHDNVPVGGRIEIRGRPWIVASIEPSDDPQVKERKILVPAEEDAQK